MCAVGSGKLGKPGAVGFCIDGCVPRGNKCGCVGTGVTTATYRLSNAKTKAAKRTVLARREVTMLPQGVKYRRTLADQASNDRAVNVVSMRCGKPRASGVACQ